MSGCVSVHLPKTTGGGNDQRTKCLETRLSISSSQHLGESEREIERERERKKERERKREGKRPLFSVGQHRERGVGDNNSNWVYKHAPF